MFLQRLLRGIRQINVFVNSSLASAKVGIFQFFDCARWFCRTGIYGDLMAKFLVSNELQAHLRHQRRRDGCISYASSTKFSTYQK